MARLTAEQRRQGRQRRPSNGRKRSKGPSRGLHRLSVQKPVCSLPRAIVMQALQPYGVRIHGYEESTVEASKKSIARIMAINPRKFDGIESLPLAYQADVWVSEAQANWAEYLLERTQKLAVVDGSVNGKNRQWADQHDGEMPKPWVEKSCQEGQAIWRQVKQIKESNR